MPIINGKLVPQLNPLAQSATEDEIPIYDVSADELKRIRVDALILSDFNYTNAAPMPSDLGGLKAGTTFNNSTVDSILDRLLYPYISPRFASLNISPTLSTLVEIGTTIASLPRTLTFTLASGTGTNIANPGVTYWAGIGTLTELGTVGGVYSGTGASRQCVYTQPALTYNVPTTYTWQVRGTDTDIPAATIPPASFMTKWAYRTFVGTSIVNNLTNPASLSNLIQPLDSKPTTFSKPETPSGQFIYVFAPPGITYTNFTYEGAPIAMGLPFVVSVTRNGVAVNYTVYRSTYAIVGAVDMVLI